MINKETVRFTSKEVRFRLVELLDKLRTAYESEVKQDYPDSTFNEFLEWESAPGDENDGLLTEYQILARLDKQAGYWSKGWQGEEWVVREDCFEQHAYEVIGKLWQHCPIYVRLDWKQTIKAFKKAHKKFELYGKKYLVKC